MDYEQTLTAVENGYKLTEGDKSAIQAEAEKRDIRLNKKCGSCYRDALIQFVTQDRKAAGIETDSLPKSRAASKRKVQWEWKLGLDVMFKGIRVNERTLTDELAEQLHREGFPRDLLWIRKPTAEERAAYLKEMRERMAQKRAEREASMTDEERQKLQERRAEVQKRMEEMKKKREELRAKLDAMTEEEKKAYMEEMKRKRKERIEEMKRVK